MNKMSKKIFFILILSISFSQFVDAQTKDLFCTTTYNCAANSRYRTIDGSCNNLARPWLGKGRTPYKRLLPDAYNDPVRILRSKSVDNKTDLPNPRSVAIAIHSTAAESSSELTILAVHLGQLLTHDITLSGAVRINGVILPCDVLPNNTDCLNIPIPPEDRINQDEPFIAVPRTNASNTNTDCVVKKREQLNVMTSWIDLSVIYGSDTPTSDSLRTKKDGLLLTQKIRGFTRDFMPPAPDGTCAQETATRKCFRSGESQVNENLLTSGIQTLFVREHNRIARIIKSLRPRYNDEEIFQEARRLMIAQYQHILYNDWLPLILGQKLSKLNDLLPSNKRFQSYDPSLNAALYSEFGTAAFRFGHAMVKSNYISKDVNYNRVLDVTLTNITNNPTQAYQFQGIDGLCRGGMTELSKKYDNHFSDGVQNHLFEVFGTAAVTKRSSLSALNINRGRDHGLQPYVKYRQLCNLPPVRSFSDLVEIPEATRASLSRIYRSVNDIDLFTGGLSESPKDGAVVGPTFACIIARQFKEFKFGDRFYYEYSLSPTELREIKRVSIARIICDNMDVLKVPLNPFLPVSGKNNFVRCSELTGTRIIENLFNNYYK